MLFNEPKLLKSGAASLGAALIDVSVLFNEPKLLKCARGGGVRHLLARVSVLFNEPKLLKSEGVNAFTAWASVSVLFNEPKLLKSESREARE